MSEYDVSDLEREFYLGNYQSCISKANIMPSHREAIYYMCLSYCSLKKFDNLSLELSKWDDEASGLIRLYSDYIRNEKDRNETIKKLDKMVDEKSPKSSDELSRLVASALYARHKNYAKALEIIDQFDTLVATYSKILILILINRADLAEKKLSIMTAKADQSPLTELAQAQVLLVNKNPTQAWRLAGSLSDRFKPTPLLYNIQTAAAICLGEYDFAKELCESSLDMDNDNLEAMINMVHILSKLKASTAVLNRNIERLMEMYPNHDFVRDLNRIQSELVSVH